MTRDETTRVASSMSQVNPGETSFCLARRLRASLAAAAETQRRLGFAGGKVMTSFR